MIYLDTSVVVPLYWSEALTNTVEALPIDEFLEYQSAIRSYRQKPGFSLIIKKPGFLKKPGFWNIDVELCRVRTAHRLLSDT